MFYPSEDWRYLSSSLRVSDGVRSLKEPGPPTSANSKFKADRETAYRIAEQYDCGTPIVQPIVLKSVDVLVVLEGCMRANGYLLSRRSMPPAMYLGTRGT